MFGVDILQCPLLGVLLSDQILHIVLVDGSVRLQGVDNLLVGDSIALQLLVATLTQLLPLPAQLQLVVVVVDGLPIVGDYLGAVALGAKHLGRFLVTVVTDHVPTATEVEIVFTGETNETEGADDTTSNFSQALKLSLLIRFDISSRARHLVDNIGVITRGHPTGG